MKADDLARHALSLPEAWEDHPWEGDRVAKVRKKIFALSLSCATPTSFGLGRARQVG